MSDKPLILITNDDGIESRGLHAVIQAVADLGDLLVVAPRSQQTAMGRSHPHVTDKNIYTNQIKLDNITVNAYNAEVAPAQAVMIAIIDIAERPIDLCISGINYGENVGSGVTISGTIGAALEAAAHDIPALAVSRETPQEYHLSNSPDIDFTAAAHFARQFTQRILSRGLPSGVDVLKLDVPGQATLDTPWRITRVSRQRYYNVLRTDVGISIKKRFEPHTTINRELLEPESDIQAMGVDRVVAVTPLTLDLSAHVSLSEMSAFFE